MPLDTYANLQTSILSWLARPGDPLVSPSIPDIIELFEREATRRLKVGGAEKRASLTALSAAVALPADFGELRLATSGGVILTYVTPMQLPDGGGPPAHYTIIGNEMRLGPSPSGGCTVEIVYQSGVPPLSDTNTTNWLLTAHPDCYLFGSLVEAESFIGSDERIPLWAQRREAAFASIETADRKARWGGAPLSIRAEGVSGGNGTAAGDWTSAPPVPIPIAAIVAGDGLTGGGTEGIVTLALSTPVTVGRGGTGAATAAAALANLGGAPLASPVFTGDPQAPTPATADNDTSVATTAYVQAQGYATAASVALKAPIANPVFTGDPRAPTPAPGDADTSIATTAFVSAALSAQALAGDVSGPTNNTAVLRLQGRPVAATAPTSLQVLQWSGTNWVPATIAAGGTLTGVTAGTGITVSGAAPSPTVALTTPVAVANGGTGAATAPAALTALGAVAKAGDTMTGLLTVTVAGTPLITRNLTNTAGYSEIAKFNVANNAGATNYSELAIAQGATNAMVLEARDQAGAKGQLQLQPFGGSILAPVIQVGTATTDSGGSGFTANNNGPKVVYWGNTSAGIGAMEFYANGVRIMALYPSGAVMVGSSGSTFGNLHVRGTAAAGTSVAMFASGPTGADSSTYLLNFADLAVTGGIGGVVRSGASAVQYLTTSDGRLKEAVVPSDLGLAALMQIKIAEFRFPGDERAQQGVVAQELYELYPDAVHAGGDDPKLDPWGIDYGRLTPLLIRTVQQQQGQIEALSARLAALEEAPPA